MVNTPKELEEISVPEFNYSQKYCDIHDKYVHRFNAESEKIKFASDLASLRAEYQYHADLIHEEINSNISTLRWQISCINETLFESNYYQNGEGGDIDDAIREKIEGVQSYLRTTLDPVKNVYGTEEDLVLALKEAYLKLFEVLDDSGIIHEDHFYKLQRALNICRQHQIIMIHGNVITYLIKEIALQNYSGKLTAYNELSEEEKKHLDPNRQEKTQLNKFVEIYVQKSDYSSEELFTYLNKWERVKGLKSPRSTAQRLASETCSKLENVSGSVLKNWEEQWVAYSSASHE